MSNSPDDARKAVRLHYKQNVDVIKVVASGGVQDESGSVDNSQLTKEEIAAVVQTAHDYGYVVACMRMDPRQCGVLCWPAWTRLSTGRL